MNKRMSISRLLLTWMLGIVFAFLLIIGFILQRNIKEIREGYHKNLEFRSSLFKESVESSVIMGDYSSVIDKSNLFFSQADVLSIKVTLRDETKLADLVKQDPDWSDRDNYKTLRSISIADRVTSAIFPVASIDVQFELSSLKNALDKFIMQGFAASLIFIVVMISSVLFFSRRFNSPLVKLSNAALSGDLQVISRISADAEIAELYSLENAIQSMGYQLIELNEKEKENFKNAAVGRVISHLSHDLRAPLAVVERFLSTPDHEMPTMKARVKESLNRLYSMVEALRYSEVETMIIKESVTFDVSFIMETLRGKADQLEINLSGPSTDLGLVVIDSMKVERALMNLVSNAIDFAKSKVRIESETIAADLYLKVIDDGPGVPDEFLPKLFQRGATHGKHDGTGLGLAYVRQIMRGHGGDVTYRRENDFTIFECLLPNAVATEREDVVENSAVLDIRFEQKLVRTVAICLEPESLSKSVLTRMASYESSEFSFSEERDEANIVVSNIDEIMFSVLEGEGQEFIHVSLAWGDENGIISRLKLKFNLS